MIRRGHFGTDRTRNDFANLFHNLDEALAGLGHQRWIRRHPIEQAARREITDLLKVSGINKKFHCSFRMDSPSA